MTTRLPQELLSLTTSHITGKEEKLIPYTLVNKSWQAAFERRIYSSLVVFSPSDVDHVAVSPTERYNKRGLSLTRLDDITSGPQCWRRTRRTYIRRVFYRVAVPYWLDPGREKDEDRIYDNHLETLKLERIDHLSPSSGVSRYANGSSAEEVLVERYVDDLYASLGYAAQGMPRLKNLNLEFGSIAHELKVLIPAFRGLRRLELLRMDHGHHGSFWSKCCHCAKSRWHGDARSGT